MCWFLLSNTDWVSQMLLSKFAIIHLDTVVNTYDFHMHIHTHFLKCILHAPMIIQDWSGHTLHYTFAHTIHYIYILIEHCHFCSYKPCIQAALPIPAPSRVLSHTLPLCKKHCCQAPAHISLFLSQAHSLPCISSLPYSPTPHVSYTLISKHKICCFWAFLL